MDIAYDVTTGTRRIIRVMPSPVQAAQSPSVIRLLCKSVLWEDTDACRPPGDHSLVHVSCHGVLARHIPPRFVSNLCQECSICRSILWNVIYGFRDDDMILEHALGLGNKL